MFISLYIAKHFVVYPVVFEEVHKTWLLKVISDYSHVKQSFLMQ